MNDEDKKEPVKEPKLPEKKGQKTPKKGLRRPRLRQVPTELKR